ncbi:hypothetical protein [Winogradskyella sp.]|uniref:hypothetical protein n=1 Tax=Winogradskyella sp. TaxID=1883156 RepID=UPI0025E79A4D|nr:hypothetical protein [Winogradskyella sp.]
MQKFKMFALAVAITFSSVLSASTNPIEKAEPASITETVGKLLKNPNFQLSKEVNVIVDIFINENDEMVVLSVDTDNKLVENYIKSRLNYKKLSKEAIDYRKSFKIPVKMIKLN